MSPASGPGPADPVDRVGLLLDRLIGLRAEPSLRSRLRRCVLDAAQVRALSVERYVECLASDDSLVEDLLNRVTVQETGFFRHPDQFRALAEHVLPAVSGTVRIWCAASANGQEPYSLAMLLAEQGRTGRVLATDVATTAVRRTEAACYSDREIITLSPERRAAHLTPAGSGWRVVEPVRALVTASPHNLLGPIPPDVADCQVVFCRNVLIYFKPEHTTAFLERLADTMAPGAYLFVGSAETIWQVTDRFEPVHLDGTFVYRALPRTGARGGRSRSGSPPAARSPSAREPMSPRPPAPSVGPSPAAVRAARPVPAPDRPAPTASSSSVSPSASAPTAAGPSAADIGRAAMAGGDPAGAVTAFRRWVYGEPDDPAAHLHLALALDAAGDEHAARRAYRSARAALDRADPAGLDAVLGNYDVAELDRLLAEKGKAYPS